MAAKFLAIEGLDGSGKQTQTALLTAELKARGFDARSISFPRYGETSAVLVEDYLHGGFGDKADDVNAYAASSFFAADRVASFLKYWHADFESADFLIADRYSTSNLIHQLAKLPEHEWGDFAEWLLDYEFNRLGLPAPSKVIYLRVDPAVSQRLLESRYKGDKSKRDIHERNLNYLERSQRAAEWCVKKLGWESIDCVEHKELRTPDSIHTELIARAGF